MTKNCLISLLLLLPLAVRGSHPDNRVTLSPDGTIAVSFFLNNEGAAGLNITLDGKPYMTINQIGYTTLDSRNLIRDYTVNSIVHSTSCDTINLLWGENKHLHYQSNHALISLSNADSIHLTIHVNVYDEGISFWFEYDNLPAGHTDRLMVATESTTYHFATDGIGWSIPANFESYEFAYREQPISHTTDASTPFTFRLTDGRWGSIHEACLVNNPEMALRQTDSLIFQVWLCPDNSGSGSSFSILGNATSNTHTITIGRQAVDLINSNFVLYSNSDAKRDTNKVCPDYHFARPIKYIGIWWGMHLGINSWTPDPRHGATTQNALRYIDFAAANNIDGVLVEGWNRGWEQWGGTQVFDYLHAAPDYDLEEVAAYALQQGVQLIMHYETGGNIPHFEEQMDSAFLWCQDHGIHYAKTGYAGAFPDRQLHHSLYGVQHYQRVVECAARHQVALDVHEPIKPTGVCRTFPNLMTAEGARGMEWNAWSDGNSPAHTTILPFTRLLAGPMDYTPGIFDITYGYIQHHPHCRQWNQKDARSCRVHTTIAKQCALWVVLYSPMVMAADLIENYAGHPMFQFFRDYNPDCEWSRALMGEPGKYIVVARQADSTWFLGAITNEEARDIELPLTFLPQTTEPHTAILYHDGCDAHYETNPYNYSIDTLSVQWCDILNLHLAPGGGCAVVIH